jgi:hypothetical protein
MRCASIRTRRALLEDDLAKCRQTSRDLALELIFDFNYPLRRVEAITGHFRPTLRVWVARAIADGRPAPAGWDTED